MQIDNGQWTIDNEEALGEAASSESGNSKPLLDIKDLVVKFHTDDGIVHAVNGLDLTLNAGETLGLVGETGAGKTTSALAIMGLID